MSRTNQLFRHALKFAAFTSSAFTFGNRTETRMLIYHRVVGSSKLELDVAPKTFDVHLDHLASVGDVVSFEDVLNEPTECLSKKRPRFVLSFDDGYLDTYTEVWPRLRERGWPAIVYVATGFIAHEHSPLGKQLAPSFEPMTWDMIRELHESRLVTIGAHTHSHANLDDLVEKDVAAEIERSDRLFERYLDDVPLHFAYPRARWSAAADALVRRRYSSAVVGGDRPLQFDGDLYRIPRAPVRRSDGTMYFSARIQGRLALEERVGDVAKRVARALHARRQDA